MLSAYDHPAGHPTPPEREEMTDPFEDSDGTYRQPKSLTAAMEADPPARRMTKA